MSADLTLAVRARMGLLAKGIQMKDIAAKCGVSKQVLSNVINSGVQESKYHAILARELDCSEAWLLRGHGPAPDWWTRPGETIAGETSVEFGNPLSPESKIRRLALLNDSILARLEGLNEESATLRAQNAALEAENRRLRKKLKQLGSEK